MRPFRFSLVASASAIAIGCSGDGAPTPISVDAELPPTAPDAAVGCSGPPSVAPTPPIDYRREMIDFVGELAAYARCRRPGFLVFPQNAAELGADPDYVAAVDGIGQEDLHYGYDADGAPTPPDVTMEIEANLDRFVAAGKRVLTIDYPFTDESTPSFDAATRARIDDAYARSRAKGYVPYASVRDLATLVVAPGHEPTVGGELDWGYRLQPNGQTREEYVAEQASQPFDLLVTDYSYDGTGDGALTAAEIAAIRAGTGGLVIAYLSIGEAEDYRSYWEPGFMPGSPSWLGEPNPDWPGNYKVRYWDPSWQRLIYGGEGAYLDQILDAGWDGAYLDIIDAYECFESGVCAP